MKNLLLIVMTLAVLGFTACGQKNDAPEKVKTSFEQKFPKAMNVKWDKENETEWEAEFKMNEKEYSANFSTDGKWMETEYEIDKTELPQSVKQTLDNEFTGYDIEKVEITETPEGMVYECALEKDETDMEVAISSDGKVVKKEVIKEEDND